MFQRKVNGFIFIMMATMALGACSSSPMKSRLDKNFVYNCSLELIRKDVAAADAQKICTASHKEEMQEKEARIQEERAVPATAPKRAPASEAAAAPAADLLAPADDSDL